MRKEFSIGFYHDLADILEMCKDNNTDNCDVEFKIQDKTLVVNFTFSIKGE